ncbi:TraR/DksA C4-type zinc finger protein [Pararhodobacter sp. SW119]|uniref:TraR/DksA family transcriptional regulator n=1 Tax=Pararhodobacter sp. SW119 TaxID=2780075 RepID=UPI001ADEFE0F|nr:TraR/DksA C4-type zinc finger protein [Pararhodobacter sp. SW119]
MTDIPQAELDRRRTQLEARLSELDARLQGIESELMSHQAKDWEELATERENDEMLTSMGEEGKQEIRMIHAALKRLDEGEYGYCTKCGDRIADARLDLLPATPFCSNCAT